MVKGRNDMTNGSQGSAEKHLLGLIDGTTGRAHPVERYEVSGLGPKELRSIEAAGAPSERATVHRPTWSALRVGESGLRLTTVIRDEEE